MAIHDFTESQQCLNKSESAMCCLMRSAAGDKSPTGNKEQQNDRRSQPTARRDHESPYSLVKYTRPNSDKNLTAINRWALRTGK
jgi:hypothetical protein